MDFLNPLEILKKIALKPDMVVADFGCGSGGWAIPLAKILEDGHVFAIDILEEPLSALRSRAKLEKIFNIDAIKANVEKGTSLLSESCDLVLMTNLLWQAENKKFIIEESKRILKTGGRALIVDWKKDNPLTLQIEKVSIEEIKQIAADLGLGLEQEFPAGPYHFSMILVK